MFPANGGKLFTLIGNYVGALNFSAVNSIIFKCSSCLCAGKDEPVCILGYDLTGTCSSVSTGTASTEVHDNSYRKKIGGKMSNGNIRTSCYTSCFARS